MYTPHIVAFYGAFPLTLDLRASLLRHLVTLCRVCGRSFLIRPGPAAILGRSECSPYPVLSAAAHLLLAPLSGALLCA